MIIRKTKTQQDHGTFFAIWPRQTPEGWVTCERLHWERVPSWGWGSGDTYRYARIPDKWKAYDDDGATSEIPFKRNPVLPTKECTYPDCTCMEEHGSNCPGGPP